MTSDKDTTDKSGKDGDSSSNTTPPPNTTPDNSSNDGGGSKTPLPSIIPSDQNAGSTDSSVGGSTKPSSTTPSSGSSSGSASSSSSSASTSATKSSSSKIPQTGVSQSAAIAATNQIINSPGSTIVNQQSIKQSVKINNEINNIIRKNVISSPSSSTTTSTTIAEEKPISNLITVKLATTTSAMSRNAYLPIGDVAPYHLIGGHITANLPSNHLYVVVAQLASSNGAIQHAVVLDMVKSQISNIYETDLGSQISGTNPITGKQDVVSYITNLFLWNNGNQQVTFVDANAVTMNLIYK
jgi:hypothetical protein